ncbi:MAG TPA: response regulator [Chthoniobacteraceae bacterium]
MNSEPTRILLAEDHHVSRHLLERSLTNWGFQVLAVEDGEAALMIMEGDDPPPLAILDWTMPKMDGLEVCRRVRARLGRPYTYLLLLTARGHRDEITTALEAGVDDYVIKPYEQDELKGRLKVGRRVVGLERRLAAQEIELQAAREELARIRSVPLGS